MVLGERASKALRRAGKTLADTATMSDEDLLGLPGIGPPVLAELRASAPPVPPSGAPAVSPAAVAIPAAAEAPPDTPLPPVPASAPPVPPSGCRCPQTWRVTRTRTRAGRLER